MKVFDTVSLKFPATSRAGSSRRPDRSVAPTRSDRFTERSRAWRRLVATLALAVASGGWALAQTSSPRPSFAEFLAGVRQEASSAGVSAATLDRVLTGLDPAPVVVSRDRAQPELVQSLDAYVEKRLTPAVVATARAQLRLHRALLDRVESAYGVPASIITAVWGLESSFGRFTGTHPTVQSLATLAYDGRRSLFRKELIDSLTILDRGDVPDERLKGSWAGAMGQPQFMPSSFLKYAVDFDGDGRPDIWQSSPDVFASMANYLKGAGWAENTRWGREVTITRAVMTQIDRSVPMRRDGCRAERETTEARPLSAWNALGVRLPGGHPLPAAELTASLVRGTRRHFLVYANYAALLDYNCSNAYAVTAGLLADTLQ